MLVSMLSIDYYHLRIKSEFICVSRFYSVLVFRLVLYILERVLYTLIENRNPFGTEYCIDVRPPQNMLYLSKVIHGLLTPCLHNEDHSF